MFLMVSGWRDRQDTTLRTVRHTIEAAMRAANLSHKECAGLLDVAPQHWSRNLRDGSNLAALIVIGQRVPVFGAALWHRVAALLAPAEDDLSRRERLLQELASLPRRVPKCVSTEPRSCSPRSSRSA